MTGRPVKPALRVDGCSYEAAKYAVMRWHYSRAMPASKLVRFGVWEGRRFVGAIIYGVGANRYLARPFGLQPSEVCELVRVALAPGRQWPTSKCVATSLKLLKRQSPGLRVVVSYADLKEGHTGTIYQATNFIYTGPSTQTYFKIHGKIAHPRTIFDRYGPGGQSIDWLRQRVDPHARRVEMPAKLKYVIGLDRKIRRELQKLSKAYPRDVLITSRSGI